MSPERQTRPPFRLLRYFSLTTLGTMVVGGIVAAAFVTDHTRREMIKQAESHAVAVAHNLIYELYHAFLFPQREITGDLQIQALENWTAVHRLVFPHLHFQSLTGAKIYAPDGTIIYSSDPEQTGVADPDNENFRAAMDGRVMSRFAHSPPGAGLPGESNAGGLAATYVPIFELQPDARSLPTSGAIIGVIELNQDVTTLIAAKRRERNLMLLLMTGAMAALYLILVGIIYRAGRRMAEDRKEIETSHVELLEQRNRLDTILTNLREGVALYDEDRRIIFMNQPMIERYGDQHGKRCYEALFGLSRPCCLTLEERQAERYCQNTWFSMATPAGDYFEIFTTPIPRQNGTSWTLELVRDIGDRVAVERQRARMDAEITRERQRTVDELAVAFNHEVNNQLAGITNTLHLLQDPKTTEATRKEALKRLNRAVKRLDGVITGLPRITEVGATVYVGNISMMDPWIVDQERETPAP